MGEAGAVPERDRLMLLISEYVLEHGVAGMTLRRLGQAIGTNNRMLLYYFGSKEKLIEQAVLACARRFPSLDDAMSGLSDREVPLLDRFVACWDGIAAPENLPFMRLFFEIFGQAAHSPGSFDAFLARVGHDWTDRVAGALRGEGVPQDATEGMAREIVALWRGLQFDLLSTGDHAAVTASHAAAAAAFAQRCRAATAVPAGRVAQPAS
jgi:AcrR family transcriptional regulator